MPKSTQCLIRPVPQERLGSLLWLFIAWHSIFPTDKQTHTESHTAVHMKCWSSNTVNPIRVRRLGKLFIFTSNILGDWAAGVHCLIHSILKGTWLLPNTLALVWGVNLGSLWGYVQTDNNSVSKNTASSFILNETPVMVYWGCCGRELHKHTQKKHLAKSWSFAAV